MRNETIFIVDDDPMMVDALATAFDGGYRIESFATAEACRRALAEKRPDLIFLDISLPGIDGYSFCLQLKENPATSEIPIIFVSGYDTLEDRLAGYDAGGSDFIVKPIDVAEVKRKAQVCLGLQASKKALADQAQSSTQLVHMLMANMGESGLVLQFLGKLMDCASAEEVAAASIDLLNSFQLLGVVQCRVGEHEVTLTSDGQTIAMAASVMHHLASMGRIYEYRNKTVCNYEHISLMISNMPLENADFCGRLRDHLASAAQGADARLRALKTEESERRKSEGIIQALGRIRASLDSLGEMQKRSRNQAKEISEALAAEMVKSFARLGLTGDQEIFLENLVSRYVVKLAENFDRGDQIQTVLSNLMSDLEKLQ